MRKSKNTEILCVFETYTHVMRAFYAILFVFVKFNEIPLKNE